MESGSSPDLAENGIVGRRGLLVVEGESVVGSKPRINRQSLGSQIARQLRQDILLGRIPPGSAVSQRELCIAYGTSRMPVRDALQQLAHEGLVQNSPAGRSVIVGMTVEDIEDSFFVEGVVHSRAARRATANATDDDLAALRSLHEQMLAATNGRDFALVGDLNWRFHGLINQLAASAKLRALVKTVSVAVPREYLVEIPEWAERSNDEHEQIVAGMDQRNPEVVAAAVCSHFEEAGANLVSYLRNRGVLPGGLEWNAP